MNLAEKDYRIWKNKNFIIESSITVSSWDEIIINNFLPRLNPHKTYSSLPTPLPFDNILVGEL